MQSIVYLLLKILCPKSHRYTYLSSTSFFKLGCMNCTLLFWDDLLSYITSSCAHVSAACHYRLLLSWTFLLLWHLYFLLPFQAQLLILLCRLSFFSSLSNCCSQCYICFSGSSLLSPSLKISFKAQLQLSFEILMTFRCLSAAQIFLSGSQLISHNLWITTSILYLTYREINLYIYFLNVFISLYF